MKLKTLGEMLAEDMHGPLAAAVALSPVLEWLNAHGVTDATPLVVEAVGTVEGEWDGDVKAEAIFYEGNSGNAIDGRTVALLAEKKQVPGIAPKTASDKPHDGTEGGG